MKTKLLFFSLVMLALGGSLFAQKLTGSPGTLVGGDMNAASAACATARSCVWATLSPNASSLSVTLSGTWTATVLAEQSADGGTTWTTVAASLANGLTTYTVTSMTDFRVRASAYTSGIASVTLSVGLLQVQSVVGGSGSGVTITTVSGLASVSGKTKGTIAVVTDGSSATDCVTGSGTNVVVCQYSGSSWAQMVAASSGSTAFAAITAGTNAAALVMGTGGSLTTSGTGTNNANQVNGAVLPASKAIVGTNSSNQIIDATSAALTNNTSGTAANLSGTPALPNGTTATTQAAADNTTKIATDAFVLANAVTNPMTTLGDELYGGVSGVPTRLAGPTTPNGVPQYLVEMPAAGAATAETFQLAGVPTNAQTGTTYTVAVTDRASYVSFSNASAIAVTLPQAGTAGFGSNFVTVACDIGVGTTTITPTTSTISYTNGSAYTSAAATLALTTGQCAWIYSDNTNYFAILRSGGAGSSSIPFGTDAANTNAYVVTFSPAVTLAAGQFAIMSVTNANSGAATLNANGLGVKNLTRKGTTSTTALTTGDIKASFPYLIEYDGTQWNLINSSPSIISDDGSATVHLPNGATLRWDGAGAIAIINNACNACQVSIAENGSGMGVFGDGATNNAVFVPGSGVGSQQALANQFTATAALTAGQTVKIDTANNNAVVVGATTDTGGGIIIGIVENSPGAAGTAYVVLSGTVTSPLLGTGTCTKGQFVIQDTTTAGRVKCTGTYTAGTVIGVVTVAQAVVGSAVSVLVQPR